MFWHKGYNIDLLLTELVSARTVTGDGGYEVLSTYRLEQIKSILSSAIKSTDVPRIIKSQAIHEAIASKQEMTVADFEKAYLRAVSKRRSDIKSFLVSFPVWCSKAILKGKLKVGDCVLDLAPSKTSKKWVAVVRYREQQREQYKHLFETCFKYVNDFNLVFCYVTATRAYDAIEIASRMLGEYLGALSLVERRDAGHVMYNGLSQPLSNTLIGPQITVHHPDGSSAINNFYFGPWNFKQHSPKEYDKREADYIIGEARSLWRSAHKGFWSDRARLALSLYFDAVSEHDQNNAFLSGWRVLELIAGTQDTSYEVRIERASKCFRNCKFYEMFGRHLKEQRNSLTHSGQQTTYSKHSLSYQMDMFIRPLMELYISNTFKFSSEPELWAFLDLSPDKMKRSRTAYLLRQADRFYG